jgi:hypothetical protein
MEKIKTWSLVFLIAITVGAIALLVFRFFYLETDLKNVMWVTALSSLLLALGLYGAMRSLSSDRRARRRDEQE